MDSEDFDLYEVLARLRKEPDPATDPEKRRQRWEAVARQKKASKERLFRIQTGRAIAKGFSSRELLLEHEQEVERQREINHERNMMNKVA